MSRAVKRDPSRCLSVKSCDNTDHPTYCGSGAAARIPARVVDSGRPEDKNQMEATIEQTQAVTRLQVCWGSTPDVAIGKANELLASGIDVLAAFPPQPAQKNWFVVVHY